MSNSTAKQIRPYHAHMFSGLIVCAECGHSLVYDRSLNGYEGYRCASRRYKNLARSHCKQRGSIAQKTIREWVDPFLREVMLHNNKDDFSSYKFLAEIIRESAPPREIIEPAEEEFNTIQNRERKFLSISPQLRHSAISVFYEENVLHQKNFLLEIIKWNEDTVYTASKEKVHELVDHLWEMPDDDINHLLKNIMRDLKICVADRTVVGLVLLHNHSSKQLTDGEH